MTKSEAAAVQARCDRASILLQDDWLDDAKQMCEKDLPAALAAREALVEALHGMHETWVNTHAYSVVPDAVRAARELLKAMGELEEK